MEFKNISDQKPVVGIDICTLENIGHHFQGTVKEEDGKLYIEQNDGVKIFFTRWEKLEEWENDLRRFYSK
jgi:hypothetical protein